MFSSTPPSHMECQCLNPRCHICCVVLAQISLLRMFGSGSTFCCPQLSILSTSSLSEHASEHRGAVLLFGRCHGHDLLQFNRASFAIHADFHILMQASTTPPLLRLADGCGLHCHCVRWWRSCGDFCIVDSECPRE